MAGRAVFLDAIDMVGGVNAFSRYENGKTKPPLALVKLLKVLDHHPALLSEVRVVELKIRNCYPVNFGDETGSSSSVGTSI